MAGFIFGLMVVVFIGWILAIGSIASGAANLLLGCPESKDDEDDEESISAWQGLATVFCIPIVLVLILANAIPLFAAILSATPFTKLPEKQMSNLINDTLDKASYLNFASILWLLITFFKLLLLIISALPVLLARLLPSKLAQAKQRLESASVFAWHHILL